MFFWIKTALVSSYRYLLEGVSQFPFFITFDFFIMSVSHLKVLSSPLFAIQVGKMCFLNNWVSLVSITSLTVLCAIKKSVSLVWE